MKKCPKCSRTFEDSRNFCDICGVPLVNIIPPAPQQSINKNLYVGGQQQNVQDPPQKKKAVTTIVIAIMAILIAVLIAVCSFFVVKNIKDSNASDTTPNEDVYNQGTADHPDMAETAVPETTTAPVATTKSPVVNNVDLAYDAFSHFYVDYLDAINALDPSRIGYCTPIVKNQMAERFDYNAKSFFDLARIDYDNDSLQIDNSGGNTTYTFYVKCVAQKYNRSNRAKTDYNYAVWQVTVTDMGDGNFLVSNMVRNDKYIPGSNVTTFTDRDSIF